MHCGFDSRLRWYQNIMMIKTILTYFLLFAMSITTAMATPKAEIELKIALTKVGYDDLKKIFTDKFIGQSSERTDIYFDIFEKDQYVLQNMEQPVKLRFMQSKENLKWQNQKIIKTASHSIFSVKTFESSGPEIPYDRNLFESIENYFLKLKQLDSQALVIAKNIQNLLVTKKLIMPSNNLTVATHVNQKKRVKIKLLLENEEFSVQVGETNNQGVMSYEMEAEVKKSQDIFKSADRLNNWLQSQGFKSDYIDNSIPMNPTAMSLIQLSKILHTQQ